MSFCDISFKRKQDGIIEVRNKRGEQSPLYSKLVEYTNQNNVYQGREWFFDKLVQQGKLKDTKPNELALGLYSIAYNSNKSEGYWLNKIDQLLPTKQSNVVDYKIKAVEILQSDKAYQMFEKGKKNNWSLDKILSELMIPKDQKELIKEVQSEVAYYDEIPFNEQLAIEVASKYSFAVEINTAMENNAPENYVEEQSEYYKNQIKYADKFYVTYEREGKFIVFSNDFDISRQSSRGSRDINSPKFNTKEESEIYRKNLVSNKIKSDTEELNKIKEFKPSLENTQYYSNLTVPGGTNYTENEISTPAITPVIKGHAAFSTEHGAGWFRADDKQQYSEKDIDSLIENMINSGVLKKNCE